MNDLNLSNRKKTLLFCGATIAYYLFFQLFYNWLKYNNPFPYRTAGEAALSIVINFIPIAILVVLNWCIVFRIRMPRLNMWVKNIVNVVESVAAVYILNEVFLKVMLLINPVYSHVDWAGTYFNDVMTLLLIEVAYYVHEFRRAAAEREQASSEALLYKYESLKSQVNPHFLFNSLNILYSLISLDQKKSKEFILQLSQMYRYILTQEGRDTIPLDDELEFARSYISVLEMRYHNQFSVDIDTRTQTAGRNIIPYTLQLLIENVTKHNVISTRHPIKITIIIDDDGLRVSNPIRRKRVEMTSKVGLHYLTDLYARHGKTFRVEDDGATFTAYVPYI